MAVEELMPIVRANPFAWRTSALLLRLVFFALTSVGVAAFYGLMKLFLLPAGLITAALTIAAAELLIVRRHFFRTGIESALWLGGLFAIIVSLPSSGKPEAHRFLRRVGCRTGRRVYRRKDPRLLASRLDWPGAGRRRCPHVDTSLATAIH